MKTVTIVSLSSGILGEEFVRFEVDIGLERLKQYGLTVKFAPHALDGIEILRDHPEYRAADLLSAFSDLETDMILCAIGGDDTYRLLPYLFDCDDLKSVMSDKVFLGFSDSTVNHFMLHKLGLKTFYGQSFLSDVCELAQGMLPYSEHYFSELIKTGTISSASPSDVWYESRREYSPGAVGTCPVSHPNEGFKLLQGPSVFSGPILGGCLDTIYDFFSGERYADMPLLCQKYRLFPTVDEWRGKILLLETSEETMSPEKYRRALMYLKDAGVFNVVRGILVGKPMDERFDGEYREILVEIVGNPDLPIVVNLNVGHATPRCILPFGKRATVDANRQVISFE